jgi:hypothetical protein
MNGCEVCEMAQSPIVECDITYIDGRSEGPKLWHLYQTEYAGVVLRAGPNRTHVTGHTSACVFSFRKMIELSYC